MANIYRQCKLEKTLSETSKSFQVAWLPAQFAKVGKKLAIKNGDDFEEGWIVVEAYTISSREELDVQRTAHKRWETVLDESLPAEPRQKIKG